MRFGGLGSGGLLGLTNGSPGARLMQRLQTRGRLSESHFFRLDRGSPKNNMHVLNRRMLKAYTPRCDRLKQNELVWCLGTVCSPDASLHNSASRKVQCPAPNTPKAKPSPWASQAQNLLRVFVARACAVVHCLPNPPKARAPTNGHVGITLNPKP